MGIEMPAEVRWLIPIVVGDSWPEGDETALQRLGEVWQQAATDVDAAMREADDAVKQAMSNMDGEAAEAFQKYWEKFVKGEEATLPKMKDVSAKLATACRNCAMQIEYAKLSIIIALVLLAIQIAMMLASAVVSFGASTAGIVPAQLATRAGVQIVFRQLVQQLTQQVGRNLIGKLALQVGIEVATSVATDLAVQGIQLAKGTRDSLDTSLTLDAAKSGLISGVVGAGVGAGAGKAFGDGVGDSIGRSIGRNAAEEAVIGAGSALAEGAFSEEGIQAKDVLFGATSGAVSGTVSGTKSGIEGINADIDVPTSGDMPRPNSTDLPGPTARTDAAPRPDALPGPSTTTSSAPTAPDADPPRRSSDATNTSYAAPPTEQPAHRAAPDSPAPAQQQQGFAQSQGQSPGQPPGQAPNAAAPNSSAPNSSAPSAAAAPRAAMPAAPPTGGPAPSSGGGYSPSGPSSSHGNAHATPTAGTPAPAAGSPNHGPAGPGPGANAPAPNHSAPQAGNAPAPNHSTPPPGGGPTPNHSTPPPGSGPTPNHSTPPTGGGPVSGGPGPAGAHHASGPGSQVPAGPPGHGHTPANPAGPISAGPHHGGGPTQAGGPVPNQHRAPAADSVHQASTAPPLAPPPRFQQDPAGPHQNPALQAPPPHQAPQHQVPPRQAPQHQAAQRQPQHQAAQPHTPPRHTPPQHAPQQGHQHRSPQAAQHQAPRSQAPQHRQAPAAPPVAAPPPTQHPNHHDPARHDHTGSNPAPHQTGPTSVHHAPDAAPVVQAVDARQDGPAPGSDAGVPAHLGHLRGMVTHSRAGLSLHPRGHFTTPLDRSAQRVAPDPQRFTVDLHGASDIAKVGDHRLSAKDVADVIRASGGWDGKQPVRLISCQTGTTKDGFAAQLSRELGVEVLAPSKDAWVDGNGNVFASSSHDSFKAGQQHKPGWPPNGDWVTFKPDGTNVKHGSPIPPGHTPTWGDTAPDTAPHSHRRNANDSGWGSFGPRGSHNAHLPPPGHVVAGRDPHGNPIYRLAEVRPVAVGLDAQGRPIDRQGRVLGPPQQQHPQPQHQQHQNQRHQDQARPNEHEPQSAAPTQQPPFPPTRSRASTYDFTPPPQQQDLGTPAQRRQGNQVFAERHGIDLDFAEEFNAGKPLRSDGTFADPLPPAPGIQRPEHFSTLWLQEQQKLMEDRKRKETEYAGMEGYDFVPGSRLLPPGLSRETPAELRQHPLLAMNPHGPMYADTPGKQSVMWHTATTPAEARSYRRDANPPWETMEQGIRVRGTELEMGGHVGGATESGYKSASRSPEHVMRREDRPVSARGSKTPTEGLIEVGEGVRMKRFYITEIYSKHVIDVDATVRDVDRGQSRDSGLKEGEVLHLGHIRPEQISRVWTQECYYDEKGEMLMSRIVGEPVTNQRFRMPDFR
ncbi:hypothetical protein [Lentzea sp. NBRC 102530]|uniref:WXG100 family type VII secretion target n=1 Tax=Lentzea sp. NBRC 102530 TaxID=3032201 RepID=UPI0025544907|nr:hypothetical protein [Lentzea sp. NBRC 102530]